MSQSIPRSRAPSTVSNSAASPAAWPSVRLRPRLRAPSARSRPSRRRRGRALVRGRCRGASRFEPSAAGFASRAQQIDDDPLDEPRDDQAGAQPGSRPVRPRRRSSGAGAIGDARRPGRRGRRPTEVRRTRSRTARGGRPRRRRRCTVVAQGAGDVPRRARRARRGPPVPATSPAGRRPPARWVMPVQALGVRPRLRPGRRGRRGTLRRASPTSRLDGVAGLVDRSRSARGWSWWRPP